jgi:hypothetical protein
MGKTSEVNEEFAKEERLNMKRKVPLSGRRGAAEGRGEVIKTNSSGVTAEYGTVSEQRDRARGRGVNSRGVQ